MTTDPDHSDKSSRQGAPDLEPTSGSGGTAVALAPGPDAPTGGLPRHPGAGLRPTADGDADCLREAGLLLRKGGSALRAGSLPIALHLLELCCGTARRVDRHSEHRRAAELIEAEALYHLAEANMLAGRPQEASAALDSAETLYSHGGTDTRTSLAVADVRARRARAQAEVGRGLSALVDIQSAVLRRARAVRPDEASAAQLALARTLTHAAAIQLEHGSTQLALGAAREACERLGTLVSAGEPLGDAARRHLAPALRFEIEALRALNRTDELSGPLDRFRSLAGPDVVARLFETPPRAARPCLVTVASDPRISEDVRAVLGRLVADPPRGACIPGLLVDPQDLLDAAREAAAAARDLAEHDRSLAIAAGRDAACLYSFAEELGLVDNPWPQVRIDLARWLWLLTEIGWLAHAEGDTVLATDFARAAQHPLVRAENGRHLPSSIARSVNESAGRLNDLRRQLR